MVTYDALVETIHVYLDDDNHTDSITDILASASTAQLHKWRLMAETSKRILDNIEHPSPYEQHEQRVYSTLMQAVFDEQMRRFK